MTYQRANQALRFWFPNAILHSRDPAPPGEMADSEAGQEKQKISPGYLVPKSYGRTEKKKKSKGHRCKLEGSFTIKAGTVPGKQ